MHFPYDEWSSQQSSQCCMRFARTKISFRVLHELEHTIVRLFLVFSVLLQNSIEWVQQGRVAKEKEHIWEHRGEERGWKKLKGWNLPCIKVSPSLKSHYFNLNPFSFCSNLCSSLIEAGMLGPKWAIGKLQLMLCTVRISSQSYTYLSSRQMKTCYL